MENVKEFFLDLIFPKFCRGCGKEGIYLCADCFSLIDVLECQFCPVCRKRLPPGFLICQNCKRKTKLSGLYFAAVYENSLVKKIINQFKYYPFVKDLSGPLAVLMIAHFLLLTEPPEFLQGDKSSEHRLISVPLAKKRLKWRGFNQSAEIAKVLSKNLSIPFLEDCLIKIKETRPQVELKEKSRAENIKGVFFAKTKEEIKGKKILLVDDVLTTGATMEECARVLKGAGAKEIFGIAVARAEQ